MPLTVTPNFTVSNGTRIALGRISRQLDEGVIRFDVTLRTAVNGTPPDCEVARVAGFEIRNGQSDRLSRGVVATGRTLQAYLVHDVAVLATPTGATDADAALAVSRATFEAFLVSSGIFAASLGAS